jgi:hypothetical protein
LGCHWSHHTQPVSSFMCVWVSGWHALVQITAPGEPFSGGYSSPQNGRVISEPALAPELPASAPFIMSASLVMPAPTCPPHSRVQPVQLGRLTGISLPTALYLNPVGRLVSQERCFFYLAVTCRLPIRGQRAALDTWRGGSGSSASSPHGLHRFCNSLTYALPYVRLCLTGHPVLPGERSPKAGAGSVTVGVHASRGRRRSGVPAGLVKTSASASGAVNWPGGWSSPAR